MRLASGLLVHVVFAIILAGFLGGPVFEPTPVPDTKPLIWTAHTGFGGGGRGGDGAKAAAATRRAVVDQTTPQFRLPQMPALLSGLELPGVVVMAATAPEGLSTSDGSSSGGRGEGSDGPGSGTGKGPGSGTGDGPFPDGTPGLTSPQVLFERKPEYTAEAMSARVEGAVLLEAAVLDDGRVGAVKVLRSIDPSFGLDQKAVEAVRDWRFRPGTYLGKPVAVKVLIELVFGLR